MLRGRGRICEYFKDDGLATLRQVSRDMEALRASSTWVPVGTAIARLSVGAVCLMTRAAGHSGSSCRESKELADCQGGKGHCKVSLALGDTASKTSYG